MISASIVVFNTDYNDLTRCLDSLFLSKKISKVLIIDNSPKSNLSHIVKAYNFVEYIQNRKNLGYGSAHNIALRRFLNTSKYHLILNPDVYFYTNVVDHLISLLEKDNKIGLCIPSVMYPDYTAQNVTKLLPTPLDLIFRRFLFLTHFFNRNYELPFHLCDHLCEAPFISGCFMLLRISVIKKVGFFDERYFMYMEDVDFSRRLFRICKTIYCPWEVIFHKHNKGSYKNLKLLFYHSVSAFKYFMKWGWFFDSERSKVNSSTLKKYKRLFEIN